MADPITLTPEQLQEKIDEAIAKATEPLKRKAEELLGEAKAAKRALAEYDGLDPKKAKALQKAADDAEAAAAAARGDFSAREKQLIEKHTTELNAKDAAIMKRQRALERRLVEAQLTDELSKAGARPAMLDLLRLKGAGHIRVRETDEDFEAYVADEKGNPLVADSKGTPMSIGLFVSDTLKKHYPDAFEGTGSDGGGAAKSRAGGAGVRTIPANAVWSEQDTKDIASGKAVVAES